MCSTSVMADRIDDLLERVNAFFPANDGGFGDDFRRMLDVADYHHNRFSWSTSQSVLNIVDELLSSMERNALLEAEYDEALV